MSEPWKQGLTTKTLDGCIADAGFPRPSIIDVPAQRLDRTVPWLNRDKSLFLMTGVPLPLRSCF